MRYIPQVHCVRSLHDDAVVSESDKVAKHSRFNDDLKTSLTSLSCETYPQVCN
jgi:hypothetical protein